MLVVDSSALVAAFAGHHRIAALDRRLAEAGELNAPHLVDVETLHALRRLVRLGELEPERADAARGMLERLDLVRYPHGGLLDRMWELRHNLSAYDAAFVALSEALDAPLVTVDARLARASGHHATVELFSA